MSGTHNDSYQVLCFTDDRVACIWEIAMNQDFASHYNPLTEWFWLIDIPGILCETSKLISILKKRKNWYKFATISFH